MQKVNTKHLAEINWSSPKGTFLGAGKEISEALGRRPQSTDLDERHPFDVEICRILYVVADNPNGESCYYPDSNKWSVPLPERRLVRSEALDYYDGEE